MDVEYQWYSQSVTIKPDKEFYVFLKSMQIKSNSSYYYNFYLKFEKQNNSNAIEVYFNSYPDDGAYYDQKIQAIVIFLDITTKK